MGLGSPWLLWSMLTQTAKLSTAVQILIFLPLTLATIGKAPFLLLSLMLTGHALIHGTLVWLWGSPALSVLQVPMHPFLLLVCFNAFSTAAPPWLTTATTGWGTLLTWSGPLFITMEGLSSLLVAQHAGQQGKRLVEEGETYQFGLLIASAVIYVVSAWWIVVAYPASAASPLSSTFLGVALTALVFLTLIGFFLRRTNVIETSVLTLVMAFNVWLCGFDPKYFSSTGPSYAAVLPDMFSHLQAMINFLTNTLPKPVLFALLYRLSILQLASGILPTIGADSWESEDGVPDEWDDRPTSTFSRLLLTYRQFIFVTVYSHLLLLDHSSQIWWRWFNIFFVLVTWAVELLVSSEDDLTSKDWKID